MESNLEFVPSTTHNVDYLVNDLNELPGYNNTKGHIVKDNGVYVYQDDGERQYTASELLQIADKLDELNRVDDKSISEKSLAALDKILKEMPKEELDDIIASVDARMRIH